MCEKKNDKQGTRENGDCCTEKKYFPSSTDKKMFIGITPQK